MVMAMPVAEPLEFRAGPTLDGPGLVLVAPFALISPPVLLFRPYSVPVDWPVMMPVPDHRRTVARSGGTLELDGPSLVQYAALANGWFGHSRPWQPRPATAWSQTIPARRTRWSPARRGREEVHASTDVQRSDVVRLDHVERARRSTALLGTLLILRMATLLVLVPADRLTYWR